MNKLRAIRDALGWSQKEMADYLGCNQATVSRAEKGEKPLRGPLDRLLDVLVKEGVRATQAEHGRQA